MSLPVSSCFLKYRILLHRCHHRRRRRRRRRRFHFCGTVGKRWRYALFQADGAPLSSIPSSLRFFLLYSSGGISKKASGAAAIAARLLQLSIEAFRTWTGYVVDFPGSFAWPGCTTALRLRILRNEALPVNVPLTEVDRTRNVLATRFCLKREFHSRIHLM